MRASPQRCVTCACRLSLHAPQCAHCLSRPRVFVATVAAFDYEPPADVLLRMLKTELRLNMAEVLANLLLDALAVAPPLPRGTLIVPIPAGRASLSARGFNPAGEIARSMAGALGLPLRLAALRRLRETPRQTSLGQRARIRGAHGLFRAQSDVAGRDIALVDDVMTTGSTMNAAAQALLAAGATSVTALVVARAP